jgi:hypothetical protein
MERDIFLGAHEKEDNSARPTYLDTVRAGQPGLRKQVEGLLQSHQEADTFLAVPAVEQVTAAEDSLVLLGPPHEPGTLGWLDHYDVLEVVSRGG